MLFKDIIEVQKKLSGDWQEIIEIKNELLIGLNEYKILNEDLLEYIFKMLDMSQMNHNIDTIWSKNKRVQNCLLNVNYNIKKYILAMSTFEKNYEKLINKDIFSTNFNDIRTSFEDFIESIQNYYYSGKNTVKILDLVKFMNQFIISINKLDSQFKYIEYLSTLLQEENKTGTNENIFEIRFFEKLSLEEIISILIILAGMYKSCQRLFQINEEINILKIETGSLLVKIAANKEIIAIIGAVMTFMAKELYSSKANPFKRKEIQLSEFKKMLDLKKQMIELGFDTSGLDEEIEIVNGILFKKSKELVESTNKIEINNEIYGTDSVKRNSLSLNPKFLEYRND